MTCQDSDCNPSSARGILGVMIGYLMIPVEWKAGIVGIADKKFDYTNYSLNSITASSSGLHSWTLWKRPAS
jgi:hypothetical protein